jgi:hypothetical protein
MSRSDPLDGKIREALADVVSHAPVAPDFDDITANPASRSKRPFRPMALAAAAVVAVVLAGVALAGTGDTTVDTGMAGQDLERGDSAATQCEEAALRLAADESNVLVFLQPDSTRDQHDEVAAAIQDASDVEVVRFVDQQASYDEFRDLFADSPEIVESVTPEILPPRFELRVAGSSHMDVIAEVLGTNPAVREVIDADQARAEMMEQCGDALSDARPTQTTTVGANDGRDSETATSQMDVEATVFMYELDESGGADGTTEVTLIPVTVRALGSDVLKEALAALWDPKTYVDSTNITTAIPFTSEFLSVTVDPSGRAVIDTSGLFGDDGLVGGSLVNALAQIVWTATAQTSVVEVQVLDDGEARPVLIDGLISVNRPVTRADYEFAD